MKKTLFLLLGLLLPYAGSSQSLIQGDVNGNGKVDIADALMIAQYAADMNPPGFILAAGDTDCSDSVNINDALNVAKLSAGLISQLPCKPTPSATPTLTPTPSPTPTPTGTIIVACSVPPMPSFAALVANAKLPDPFKFMNGTRMTRKEEWPCRRAEISALAQTFEYGMMPPPVTSVTGSYSSNTLTVTCSYGGKTISFAGKITPPGKGTPPYPAIITIGGSFLNNTTLSNLGVALIDLPSTDIAALSGSSTRGQGKFYTLYGSNASAGSVMAYAWGCGRLIDALEKTPAAGIDPKRMGVTGCSLNGKGALGCGAFEERIALTIPQESGSGGSGSWRIAQASSGVQPLAQAVQENCWFTSSFSQFGSQVNKLPTDHHEVIALCAPRAVLIIENTSYTWLGAVSCWNDSNAAHEVWTALGIPDKMGITQVGHGDHCGLPGSQDTIVSAFVQKFLLGNTSVNTKVVATDGGLAYDKAKWVDWTTPALQ